MPWLERLKAMKTPPTAAFTRPIETTQDSGGTWQAIVEIAFDVHDGDQQNLHLRELHTIYSGDIRKVRRRDPVSLSRLNETLDDWAASYGTGIAKR